MSATKRVLVLSAVCVECLLGHCDCVAVFHICFALMTACLPRKVSLYLFRFVFPHPIFLRVLCVHD